MNALALRSPGLTALRCVSSSLHARFCIERRLQAWTARSLKSLDSNHFNDDEKSSRQRRLINYSKEYENQNTGRLLAALRQRHLAGLQRPLLEQCLGEETKG